MTATVHQLQTPPKKPAEIEAMLLGAVISAADPCALIDASGLGEGDFSDRRISTCWGLAQRLASRKRGADAASLWAAGVAGKAIDESDSGCLEWLLGLQANNTLSPERFSQVADEARRMVRARWLGAALRQLQQKLQTEGLRPAQMAGDLEALAEALARDHTPDKSGAADLVEVIEAWRTVGDRPGTQGLVVPTGLKVLDDVMNGYVPGLNIVFGPAGMGKSATIASGIESQVVNHGMTVGLFGLEEGTRWVQKRLLAKHVGVAVGDVARLKPTPEQDARIETIAPALHSAMGRLLCCDVMGLGVDELLRRITDWVLFKGVQCIYVDHIGEIRHKFRSGNDGQNWAVAETYRRVRDVAFRRGVPVVMIAHSKSDPQIQERKGPPVQSDLGLTGEGVKIVRRMIGLWRKGNALRATVVKTNEGAPGQTVEFERLYEAALVEPMGGHTVDVEAEQRKEETERKARKQEEADANAKRTRMRNRGWNAEDKAKPVEAPPPAAPAPQMDLLPEGKP